MHIHLQIIGIVLMALALIHVIFPKYFKWDEELQRLSTINREMMIVHTFFIALAVFLMGLLCFTSSSEIIDTPLGKKVALGFGVFWLIRLFIQFFGYSSTLWKGKTFETSMHIIFTLLWTYLSYIFLAIWWL
jgi:hypothetical protein